MSTTTSGVNAADGGNKTPTGSVKARAAQEALKKELKKIDKEGFAVGIIGIKPGIFKLIVNAQSQVLLDKLVKKYPDLKFQGIEIETRVVVGKIVAQKGKK